jgi:hypothetical protein
MHPRPWLGVAKAVVSSDALAQGREGGIIIAFVIFQFSLQHLLTDAQYRVSVIAEESTIRRDTPKTFVKQDPLCLGRGNVPERRECDTSRIVLHRGRDQVKVRIVRHWLVDNRLPLTEPHQYVHFHRIVGLAGVGEFRPVRNGQDFPRQDAPDRVRGFQRALVSTKKHAGEDHKMKIVTAGRDVKIE